MAHAHLPVLHGRLALCSVYDLQNISSVALRARRREVDGRWQGGTGKPHLLSNLSTYGAIPCWDQRARISPASHVRCQNCQLMALPAAAIVPPAAPRPTAFAVKSVNLWR